MMHKDPKEASLAPLGENPDESIPAVCFRSSVVNMIAELNTNVYQSALHKDWKPLALVDVTQEQRTNMCLAVWSYITAKMDEMGIDLRTKKNFKEILLCIFVHKRFALDQSATDTLQTNNVCFGNTKAYTAT